MSATTATTAVFALADVVVQAPVTLASVGRSRSIALTSAHALYFVGKPSSCPLGIVAVHAMSYAACYSAYHADHLLAAGAVADAAVAAPEEEEALAPPAVAAPSALAPLAPLTTTTNNKLVGAELGGERRCTERIWLNLLLSARSQVQLQKTMMKRHNAEGGALGVVVGAETRARAIIINNKNNKRRRLLLLSAPVSGETDDEATDDIECLDHIRTAARHHSA
jgi:hypothetical protein